MGVTNKWVGYVDRSYEQIKDRCLTLMQSLTPEITDHTESNPFVNHLSIFSGIAEMLGYYIDNAAREAHLDSCRLYWSAIKIARSYNYRVHSYLPSTGSVTFILSESTITHKIIPSNTEVENADGILFYTVEDALLLAGTTEITVGVRQSESVASTSLGISDGSASLSLKITDTVVDGSCIVTVGSDIWTNVDTLSYSMPQDKHFIQTIDKNKNPVLLFGDGINGAIPPNGDDISVEYQKTAGELGNVGENTITTINSTIIVPSGLTLSCTNRERTSGGSNVESLAQLKSRVPKANRTLKRAVTEQDYIDVTEMMPSVVRAGVSFDCGKNVEIHIVPNGGGIASPSLISDTEIWLDDKKMITTKILVSSAGEIRVLYDISIEVYPQFVRSITIQAVKDNLVEFMSHAKQEIGGKVELSDVYELIENTKGVKNSTLNVMKPRPYARGLFGTTSTLNWLRSIQATSNSTKYWTIKIVSATTYELIYDTTYVGTYSIGSQISLPDVIITVQAGSYTIGDQWGFYTYPYFGTLNLKESSLPVSLESDITIQATGGI